MNRTYHQFVSVQGLLVVVLLALAALICFLLRTGLSPLVGCCCLLLGAAAVDRLVNTTYTFTPDNNLVIARGRLGKPIVVPVGDIIAVHAMRGSLLIARHIIIEYGAGHITFAQPALADDFIAEIHKRQNKINSNDDDE